MFMPLYTLFHTPRSIFVVYMLSCMLTKSELTNLLTGSGPRYPQMKDSAASSPLIVAMELDLGLSTRTSTTTLQFDCCCSYCWCASNLTGLDQQFLPILVLSAQNLLNIWNISRLEWWIFKNFFCGFRGDFVLRINEVFDLGIWKPKIDTSWNWTQWLIGKTSQHNKAILCKMHLGLDFHSELDQAAIEAINSLVNCLQMQTSIHDDCGLAFNEPTNETPTRTWLMYVHLLKSIHPKEHDLNNIITTIILLINSLIWIHNIHRQTIKNCYEKEISHWIGKGCMLYKALFIESKVPHKMIGKYDTTIPYRTLLAILVIIALWLVEVGASMLEVVYVDKL